MGVYGTIRSNVLDAGSVISSWTRSTSASANTWYELTSSAAEGYVVLGVVIPNFQTGARVTVDIGTGAAGSEVAVATVVSGFGWRAGDNTNNAWFTFTRPIRIAAGTRVAVRASLTCGSGYRVWYAREASIA